jgi:hypothetical protein
MRWVLVGWSCLFRSVEVGLGKRLRSSRESTPAAQPSHAAFLLGCGGNLRGLRLGCCIGLAHHLWTARATDVSSSSPVRLVFSLVPDS